ncbi:MAG TPA: hypothetical protein VEA69_14700 [Tepidisphaeraceae bacterium]|nr:hypothetical protein [Tepidisphaeraceae bacterium]
MPVPEWLMRFEFNPAFLPLTEDNAEGIARSLDDLATTISVMAVEYRKKEHKTTPVIEIFGVGEASRELASDRQSKGD